MNKPTPSQIILMILHAALIACLVFICFQIYSFRGYIERAEVMVEKAQAASAKVEHAKEVAVQKIDTVSDKLKGFIGKDEIEARNK